MKQTGQDLLRDLVRDANYQRNPAVASAVAEVRSILSTDRHVSNAENAASFFGLTAELVGALWRPVFDAKGRSQGAGWWLDRVVFEAEHALATLPIDEAKTLFMVLAPSRGEMPLDDDCTVQLEEYVAHSLMDRALGAEVLTVSVETTRAFLHVWVLLTTRQTTDVDELRAALAHLFVVVHQMHATAVRGYFELEVRDL